MPVYEIDAHHPEIDPSVFVAPNASIIGRVTINRNASIWFNTVIRADFEKIYIGDESNIQDLTMCHADAGCPLIIGRGVTIGHNSVVHGCTIEDDCLVGMGSIIMNGAVIKKGSLIAAGSVILENTIIPENSLVTGSPGKVKKTLSNDSIEIIRASADIYKNKALGYLTPATFKLSK